MFLRRIAPLGLLFQLACFGDGADVKVSASGLASGSLGQTSGALRQGLAVPQEYDGIGINYSQAVVDGLKIDLTGIRFGEGVKGEGLETLVFDWSDAPREIEIRDGYSATIEDSASIAPGNYTFMEVYFKGHYSLKAYAYFDADFDGTVDTTMYTTTAAVLKVPQKLLPSEMEGYDFYRYDRTYVHLEPGREAASFTMPPEPLVVDETTETLTVDVRIDAYRVVTAWDGRVGTGSYPPSVPGEIPAVGEPFWNPGSAWGYEAGTPSFGLRLIPFFAFGRTDGASQPTSFHTYLAARSETFDPFDSAVLTVIFDGDGKPIVGDLNGASWIGELAKVFEPQQDGTWSFYTGGTSAQDDGGFFHSNDPARAAHQITGFAPSPEVGTVNVATMLNAARCDDVHNYCVPDESGMATADNGASMPLYLKRVR